MKNKQHKPHEPGDKTQINLSYEVLEDLKLVQLLMSDGGAFVPMRETARRLTDNWLRDQVLQLAARDKAGLKNVLEGTTKSLLLEWAGRNRI